MKVWLPRREQNIYKLFLKTRNSFLCVRACVSESVFCILGILPEHLLDEGRCPWCKEKNLLIMFVSLLFFIWVCFF